MRNWIANLIRRFRKPATTKETPPCVYSVAEAGIRVDVLEHLLPCGHTAYSILGEFYVEELRDWVTVVNLRDYNAQTALKLITRSVKFVAAMERSPVSAG